MKIKKIIKIIVPVLILAIFFTGAFFLGKNMNLFTGKTSENISKKEESSEQTRKNDGRSVIEIDVESQDSKEKSESSETEVKPESPAEESSKTESAETEESSDSEAAEESEDSSENEEEKSSEPEESNENSEKLTAILSEAGYGMDDVADCGQLVVVHSSGITAEVSLYAKNESGVWENVGLDTSGYVGSEGVTDSPSEGYSGTPKGLYGIGEAFYIDSRPQTGLNTFAVTENTYWVDDPGSKFYNQRVEGTEEQDWNSAEHMIDYPSSYRYGFVIEYNTANSPTGIIAGKGSAFFFHCSTGGATAGCVAVSEDMVLAYLSRLDGSESPKILIY